MKKIGLIGGTSWVSTVDYYKLINEKVNAKLGGLNFAECMIYSVNYADVVNNLNKNDWDAILQLFIKAGTGLKASGATTIALCSGTMNYLAEPLQSAIDLPVLHMATATAKDIQAKGLKKIGLLGTKKTMELDYFKDKLIDAGIEVIIPEDEDRNYMHQTIFDELGKGIIREETQQKYLSIIQKLIENGAQGIVLACTEIPLLIHQSDVSVPVIDTVEAHTDALVKYILG